MSKLDEIRAAVAECSVLEDGATPEARQRENAQRLRAFRKLDSYAAELTAACAAAAESGEETAGIEALQRELEALASTLVMRPIQPSWPLFEAIDMLWRVPAVMLFLLFMGFVVSIPLIMLTLVEQQLFLARSRRRAPLHGINTTSGSMTQRSSSTGSAGSGSSTSPDALAPADSTAATAASASATPFEAATGVTGAARGGGGGAAVAAPGDADAAALAPPPSEHLGGDGGNTGGLSSILIRLDCAWLLLLMGIQVRAEGLSERSLSRPAMLLFTHVSTLDAVVILGTLPRALCAVVKEELLGVPVLGWIMASRGAIPINRGHRASAVQALAEAAERARELQMFVAMAPEGTRTKTGQLGPFKKGALHMQEQLGWPVIPVTIRGGYELFPLKWNVNQCGKVVVKYHKPIEAVEIKSRDGLSRRLREEMLEALDNDPSPEAGTALDPSRRVAGVAAAAVTYWAAASAASALVRFSRREGVAIWALVLGALAYVFLSTVFVFYVYARKCFSKPAAARGGGGSGGWGRAAENGGGGVALVGGAGGGVAGTRGTEAVSTTEFSRLLGGGASSREADQMKDR